MNISDKVVCVDGKRRNQDPRLDSYVYPVEGVVYVIRDVWEDSRASEGWLIQLVGFPEFHTRCGIRAGWTPSRFRKLDEVKSDFLAAQRVKIKARMESA